MLYFYGLNLDVIRLLDLMTVKSNIYVYVAFSIRMDFSVNHKI